MKLQFMSYDTVEILRERVGSNLKYYESPNSDWVKEVIPGNEIFLNSRIDIPDDGIKLKISEKPEKDDFENIKILFETLKHLTNCQAADERVWVALAHGMLWDYMQKRWPLAKTNREKKEYILKNYFFKHGTRSLLTNGLARLWWFGKLTYLEGAEDPYELTEYLCRDINGKGFPLLGSNFSNNIATTSTFLKTIKKFEEDNDVVLDRMQFIKMIRIVNLWGGKLIVDSLPKEEFEARLIKYLKKITNK